MITESGRVERLEDGFAWVVCAGQSGCVRCAEGRGCGGGLLGRLLGDRLHRVRALPGGHALRAGDRVELGLQEAALLRGALRVYGLPLLGLIGLPLTVRLMTGMSGDGTMLIAALAGLAAGLMMARRGSTRLARDPLYQPHVIRRLDRPCAPPQ